MTDNDYADEHMTIREARIVDSVRSTVAGLLQGHSERLQASVVRLRNDMQEEPTLRHADTAEVSQHAVAMARYIGRLVELNATMYRLHRMANAAGVQWPESLRDTVVIPKLKVSP